jgi:hypothetical protein
MFLCNIPRPSSGSKIELTNQHARKTISELNVGTSSLLLLLLLLLFNLTANGFYPVTVVLQ